MLIFLSGIFHNFNNKVIYMFLLPFLCIWSSLACAPKMYFDFVVCVMRQWLRACDVARVLVALFPYICSYKYQARSFERPGGIIVKLPRSLTDSTLGMIWSFDRKYCYVNSRWSRELGQRYSSGIPRTKRKIFVLRSSKCAVLCEIDVLDL